MPLGIKQNNQPAAYLTLDVWQDLVFLNEQAYPAGYFAANIMNQDQATLQALIHYGGAISNEAEALMKRGSGHLCPSTSTGARRMSPPCWMCCGHTRPICFLDKSRELEVLDQYFRERMVDALMTPEAPYRDFFFRYLTAAFAIPLGIYHFVVAGGLF